MSLKCILSVLKIRLVFVKFLLLMLLLCCCSVNLFLFNPNREAEIDDGITSLYIMR